MEALVASGAAHGRWDTSGRGSQHSWRTSASGAADIGHGTGSQSQHSLRTSASSAADIGHDTLEVTNGGGEAVEDQANQAAEGKVFVAVSDEVKRGMSAVRWALKNLARDGAQVVIAHVHCPAQMIPMSKGKLEDGQVVAVRWLRATYWQLEDELVLTAKLKHDNIVQLLGVCLEQRQKLLVYEYLPYASLDTILYRTNSVPSRLFL